MNLRVWNVINPPNNARYYKVDSPEQAIKKINSIAKRQLKNENIFANAFGLQEFDEETQEWIEWMNEYGEDIDEYEEKLEEQNV